MNAITAAETNLFEPAPDLVDEVIRIRLDTCAYELFRGTRGAFLAEFPKVLAEHCPELVARFPQINPVDEDYGFIAGCVIVSTRNQTPYFWVGMSGSRHWDLEQAIRAFGTLDEIARVQQFRRGFMVNSGRMVSRTSARRIAERSGQLLVKAEKRSELYSDDLW